MDKIPITEIRIERMNETHNVSNFESYEQELVNFLKQDALKNQMSRISVTYLWFLKTGELAGYITLLTDRIHLEESLKESFRLKGILYKALPAVKIGRLCVDNNFLRRGIGTLMIDFSVKIGLNIHSRYCGCRFVVLDAKRGEKMDPIHFYKKHGFKELKQRERGTIPMYLDLINDVKFGL